MRTQFTRQYPTLMVDICSNNNLNNNSTAYYKLKETKIAR